MEEIASTFEHLGITPNFHKGAAEMYRLLSKTPYAGNRPKARTRTAPPPTPYERRSTSCSPTPPPPTRPRTKP